MGHLRHEGNLPSLDGATAWLNSSPVTTEGLRGRVVVVDFWTYTCINWLRTLPYVRAWADEYEADGLVVIGVHTPEFGFEHDIDNVRRAVEEMNIELPDRHRQRIRSVARRSTTTTGPRSTSSTRRGEIRHHHFGEGEYEQSELVIQICSRTRVQEVHATTAPLPTRTASRSKRPGTTSRSPETYVGYGRSEQFASPGGVSYDERHEYAVPARLQRNEWALRGAWTIGQEQAESTSRTRRHRLPLPRS